jgi:hypothetical protein
MKIFISIVSYKDTELTPTIKSLMGNADNPDDLYFGVVSQDDMKKHPDLSFVKNLSYLKMDFRESRGAGYARKLAIEMYKGEDFFLQIDSHMRAELHWDSKIKKMYKESTEIANTKKIIMSQYPAAYEIHTDGKEHFFKDHEELWSIPTWSKVHNREDGSWSSLRQEFKDLSRPHVSHTVLAGYLFAPSAFVEEIPYDERISFMGEELCIAIRAYTRGWQMYAPNEMLFWHFYKRKRSPKVWNQMDDAKRPRKWMDIEMESKRTQKNILTGREQGVFGIGSQEKYLEYQELIGINFNNFYDNHLSKKVNKAVLVEEINFSGMVKLSKWCIDEEHKECETKGCECNCHNKGEEDE